MQASSRRTIVDTLLNTLEAERFARAALLRAVIDELDHAKELAVAAGAARALFIQLANGDVPETAFVQRVSEVRLLLAQSASLPAA